MKNLLIVLAALVMLGPACRFGEGGDGAPGSSLRPDGFPGGAAGFPPPSDVRVFTPSLASDGTPFPDGILTKKHSVGTSPCPDPFPPLVLPWPDGQMPPDGPPPIFYPETDAPWLGMPDTVVPGEPFTPEFNCRIADRSPHTEDANVYFRIEGHVGGTVDDSTEELDSDVARYNLPVKVLPLKVELEVK